MGGTSNVYPSRRMRRPGPSCATRRKTEMKHFGMDLEFLLRKKPEWREILQKILFTTGDIVARAEEAEKEVD